MTAEDTPGLDVDMVAASLRADAQDLDAYTHVLLESLGEALPPDLVEVTRDRSLGDRFAGRPGRVTAVRVRVDDASLELHRGADGRTRAARLTQVRGVTISRKDLTLAEWAQELAALLVSAAEESREAAVQLRRVLGL
jgi:hypothetical protein